MNRKLQIQNMSSDDVVNALSSTGSIGEVAKDLAQSKVVALEHFEREVPEGRKKVVPLGWLKESPTNPRQNFTGIEELSASLKRQGLLSPLWVRQLNDEGREARYEIVFGHRRFRAAQLLGWEEIAVDVRELTDVQVMEAQLAENEQRADLHPLEAAEMYQRLIDTAGYTADMLATKTGRTRSWVYQRLKLLSLCTEARKAFVEGKLALSVAVPLARVPTPKLQAKAVERICGAEPWSARNAIEWLQNEFCVPLKTATFDRKDDMLVEGAPACSACPKRSGSGTPGLFEDLSTPTDMCTDTVCFAAKTRATWDTKAEKFAKQGAEVLSVSEGKKLFRDGSLIHGTQYVELDQPVHEDPKKRTWSQILETAEKQPQVVVAPDASMRAHRLYVAEDAFGVAAELGLPWAKKQAKRAEAKRPEATAEEGRSREVRERVAQDVLVTAANSIRSAVKPPGMAYLLLALAVENTIGSQRPPARAYLERLKVSDFARWASKAEPQALLGYVFAVLVDDWCGHVHGGFEPGLEQTAKAFGLDLKAMVAGASAKDEAKSKAEELFNSKSKKA